jgi:predicted nucleotidyltransferase
MIETLFAKRERTMVHLSSEVKKISDCLEKDERISAAYVFGSAVTGRLRGDSDLDIA